MLRTLLVIWSLAALVAVSQAASITLSSSKIESCLLDGSSTNVTLACQQKMTVLFAVSTGEVATSQVRAVVESVEDIDGKPRTLKTPITIEIRKSPVYVSYRMYYTQTVNGRPREDVYTKRLVGDICQDGAYAPDPTCGWALDNVGNPIPHSQGFCCLCEVDDVFSGYQLRRANLDCNLFGDQYSSASCLRFSDNWYDVFQLGQPQTQYNIDVAISNGSFVEILQLSFSEPVKVSEKFGVRVSLIGDMNAAVQAPSLVDKYLLAKMKPTPGPTSEWLLLPESMVDLTGQTCNKIGVGYWAFRNEANKCRNYAGSCIMNQPDEVLEKDKVRVAQGLPPNHLMRRYANFIFAATSQFSPLPHLMYIDNQIRNTLLSLELAADNLQFVTYKSSGKILFAKIETFEAFSRQGKLTILIQNTGVVASTYYVEVTNCTEGISTVPAQQGALPALAEWVFIFDLHSQSVIDATSSCNVNLRASTYEILDSLWVTFNVTKVEENKGDQGGTAPPMWGNTANLEAGCQCSFLNISCYIFGGCSSQLITFFIVLAVIVVAFLVMCCCGGRMLRCCKAQWTKTFKKSSGEPKKAKPRPNSMTVHVDSPGSTPTRPMIAKSRFKSKFNDNEKSSHPTTPREMDETILNELAAKSSFVFLNVHSEDYAKVMPERPGSKFSIKGRITLLPEGIVTGDDEGGVTELDPSKVLYLFDLVPGYDYQKWYISEEGTKEVTLKPLRSAVENSKLSRLFTASEAPKHLSYPKPLYPCINVDLM